MYPNTDQKYVLKRVSEARGGGGGGNYNRSFLMRTTPHLSFKTWGGGLFGGAVWGGSSRGSGGGSGRGSGGRPARGGGGGGVRVRFPELVEPFLVL